MLKETFVKPLNALVATAVPLVLFSPNWSFIGKLVWTASFIINVGATLPDYTMLCHVTKSMAEFFMNGRKTNSI